MHSDSTSPPQMSRAQQLLFALPLLAIGLLLTAATVAQPLLDELLSNYLSF